VSDAAHPRSEAEGCATEAALAEAERQRDEALARLWARKLVDDRVSVEDDRSYAEMVRRRDREQARAVAAEAALDDTRRALRNLLAWADETVEAITLDYGAVGADETAPLEAARAVLAAVPSQQGAPADTDARPANNAGTRGGESL
jgi:hypothetical protein